MFNFFFFVWGGGGGEGVEFKNSNFFFQKSNCCISLPVYLHVLFFLSFVCFVSDLFGPSRLFRNQQYL